MRRRALVMFAVSCAAAMAMAGSASASTGNSGAAQACQHGGYMSMFRTDGSSFKNAGACVSYFAQGGTSCSVVPDVSGCAIFDNVSGAINGDTSRIIVVNGAFAFSTTACVSLTCTAPNDYATGGGTMAVYDNGTQVGLLTFTADGNLGSEEGLIQTGFFEADGNATTCAAASSRGVEVQVSVTGDLGGDPYTGNWGMDFAVGPDASGLALTSPDFGVDLLQSLTGLTISC